MTLQGKTICFLANNIPPAYGGGGLQAVQYARYLAERGQKVRFFSITQNPEPIHPNVELQILRIPKVYKKSSFFRHVFNPLILRRLNRLFRREDIDVIHCMSASWISLLALWVARRKRIPTLLETTLIGSDDPVSLRNKKLGRVKLFLFKLAGQVANMSPALRDRCLEVGIPDDRCHVVPNSVDTDLYAPVSPSEKALLKQRLGLEEFDQVLISVGILSPRKKTENVVKIFARLAEDYPKCGLVLLGPTEKNRENIEYTQEIKDLARTHGLENRVRIPGLLSNVQEWLQASDLFLFASLREGFGTVFVEAMSVGLPVVAFEIDRITDYIFENGENGLIVSDLNAATDATKRLLSDEKLREKMGRTARASASARFSEDVVMEQYLAIYKSLIDSRSSESY